MWMDVLLLTVTVKLSFSGPDVTDICSFKEVEIIMPH